MFKRIQEFFKGTATLDVDATGAPTQRDALTATGVLLLEVAGQDSDYAPEETREVFRTIEAQFGIRKEEAMELLEIADAARNETKKIDEFVKNINTHFSLDQRVRILAMAYRVILADEKLDKEELRYLTQLKFRLQLSDEQLERAKELVESGEV